MDQSTTADWMQIGQQVAVRQAAMPAVVKAMLLQLAEQTDGFAINQLQHGLQTATRAARAGASEELIVAALCHDIGKVISVANHPAIAAEMLRPYVSETTYQIIRTHQDFQGRHYYALMGKDANARAQYVNEPWYARAEQFTDEWDQTAFDPAYDTLPLEHFAPLLEKVFGKNPFAAQAASAK